VFSAWVKAVYGLPLKQVKKLDVMVAGDLFMDIIMSGFPYWPQPGQESVASEMRREVGGGAAITACGLAKLGSTVGVLGVVGSDAGAWVIDHLRKCGVQTSAFITN
jgi:sugar/nucleoside kinase (ribokinase family)